MRRISSGASRETFGMRTAGRGALVAQLARERHKIVESAPQAALLEAAADAGVPVPRVVAHGDFDDVLGSGWTVTDALAGTADPGVVLAGESVPQPDQLIDEIARALAGVHRIALDVASPCRPSRTSWSSCGQERPARRAAPRLRARVWGARTGRPPRAHGRPRRLPHRQPDGR